jgi:quinol monooxygenase YgiN
MPSSDCNSSMVSCIATGQGPRVQGDNVILSLIELTPILGKREKILELLRFSGDRVTGRPGCLSSGVYEAGDQKHILYLERWESEEALHRHIQSSLYRGVLNALDLAQEPRGITFHKISDTKSMELILALRAASVG